MSWPALMHFKVKYKWLSSYLLFWIIYVTASFCMHMLDPIMENDYIITIYQTKLWQYMYLQTLV